MSRQKDKGTCEHCHRDFGYFLVHNGFNDSTYAYCEKCGQTALLDGWKMPKGLTVKIHQSITSEAESFLKLCPCGGTFRSNANPRCPHCLQPLSADAVAEFIERNAPGTVKGWRWQRNWTGLYCILIEDRVVKDNWNEKALYFQSKITTSTKT